jgi:hypothetical protein
VKALVVENIQALGLGLKLTTKVSVQIQETETKEFSASFNKPDKSKSSTNPFIDITKKCTKECTQIKFRSGSVFVALLWDYLSNIETKVFISFYQSKKLAFLFSSEIFRFSQCCTWHLHKYVSCLCVLSFVSRWVHQLQLLDHMAFLV